VVPLSWFDSLEPSLRDWLRSKMEPLTLESGQQLFAAGSPSDCLYLVTRGALGAFAPGDDSTLLGQVVAGETVGELGLVTKRPRTATVRAVRDCALLRLSPEGFDTLCGTHPEAVLALARVVLERAQRPIHQRLAAHPRTIALLPQRDGLHLDAFARWLADGLGGDAKVAIVRRDDAPTDDALDALERDRAFVIYLARPEADAWRRRCLRQADALVFAVDHEPCAPWCELERGVQAPLPRPEHLVVMHAGDVPPGAGRPWKEKRPRAQLHHLRGAGDAPRIARLISGEPKGIVLSGGGARGFAHLGVLRALEEANMPIDVVGGASIGAIIGAGYAAGWSISEMTQVFRSSFIAENPLSDWTLPFVSLVGGRSVSRLLKDAYGRRDIEDLVLPYFCVSTNLTAGRSVVHRSGRLWKWLRASASIPGVLPPVFHGGQVLVDGGVMNNLPVDAMRDGLVSDVIAVDIGADNALLAPATLEEFELPTIWRVMWDWLTGTRRPSLARLMLGSGMVNSAAATSAARASSSLVLTPPVSDIDLLEFESFDLAVERGYESTVRALEEQR
jgi:NTE family protein